MAFYPNYQQSYQPNYQQSYQQVLYPQQQAQSNGIIWVQGEAGAKSYLVAPNTTVQLWDSEAPVIYIKSADASGMPSIKVLDYVVRERAESERKQVTQPNVEYVTRDEFNALKNEIRGLKKEVKSDDAE